MDHPHVQQRGFVAPAPDPVQQQQQHQQLLQPSQRSILGQTPAASQCRESLLSRVLKRDGDAEGDDRDKAGVAGFGVTLDSVAGPLPKPILRRASCVESTVCGGRIEERSSQAGNDEQFQQSQHPSSSVPQPPLIFQQPPLLNQPQPPLVRKTSLKFAIAPPPTHLTAPLYSSASATEPPYPGSRRSSLESGPNVAVEADQVDGLAERLIGDIEEDDEEQVEDDEDQDDEDQDDEDHDEDDDDDDDDGEYNDDSISNPDHEDAQDEDDEDEDRYSSTNWSGYEEDSEAGLSDEELAIKETLIVSPGPRRKLASRDALAEDVEGSTAFASDRAALATHISSIASPQNPSFAFARPTNYRRRRPASLASDGGAGTGVGGSISSLLAVGGASFVKIDPAERIHRGRGAVQILDPIPQGARTRRNTGTETDTCTRHCSPPPAMDRSRSSSRGIPPAVSGIGHVMKPPRADLSPSAIRMQARRGNGDPRKRKQRDTVAQLNLFGPSGRVARALTTDDDLGDRRLDTTEDEFALGARRELTRGWRSDDALFAVPMVRRYPTAVAQYLPPDTGSGKNSVISVVKYPATSSVPPSDMEQLEAFSDGLVNPQQAIRRASDKIVSRRVSTCSAQPINNGLLSPTEPIIAHFGASVPCPPAVDDTPALASGTSFCPSTPVDQILHETLTGTPGRRRGSDVTSNNIPYIKTTEGSGSDGYRSRASSAMGFRSDDGRVQPHPPSSSTPIYHQQSASYIPSRKGYFEEGVEAPRSLSTTLVTSVNQPCKSRPIKCPSPRRRTQDEVRT
ncbi:hypothetical protein NliqN6_0926 [Naganishia liquefaciens]|uniref:Uncharacterized protein n=1 Tax=Naganishia liquefaciens TaxID=104408 RepID=A0A8H3TPB1_9TREE|nr:hypothetical protein NliqN6_0926 [Naganishia liquefaciens]